MKRLIFAFCALAVVASTAFADVPQPSNCSSTLDATGRLLIVPNTPTPYAGAAFTVTIKNGANNPINNAVVEILIGGLTDNKTHVCALQSTTGNTNASGIASFNIGGGGCFKGTNACVIRANGVEIRNYNATVSPDYTAADNSGIAGRWNMAVGLPDFSQFVIAYTGSVTSCHDYDNNGATGLTDFAVFVSCYNKVCNP
jgi:hypothetical protein